MGKHQSQSLCFSYIESMGVDEGSEQISMIPLAPIRGFCARVFFFILYVNSNGHLETVS